MINDYIQLLYSKYEKMNLTRKELAFELGISVSSLEKLIAEDRLPIRYKRLGSTQKARYVFPLLEVARFLSFENMGRVAA